MCYKWGDYGETTQAILWRSKATEPHSNLQHNKGRVTKLALAKVNMLKSKQQQNSQVFSDMMEDKQLQREPKTANGDVRIIISHNHNIQHCCCNLYVY